MATAHDTLSEAPDDAIYDCWNRIGVRGDKSCPELVSHVHCRNCPVHAAAALGLLDRAPPDGYLAEWSRHVAQSEIADGERRDSGSALIFRVGAEWLALPTTAIQEVAELRPIHSLPRRTNGTVLGIANIRGEILACVALAGLLGLDAVAEGEGQDVRTAHRRLVVAGWQGKRIVLPVDEVHGVLRFDVEALAAVPAILAGSGKPFTRGMLAWQQRTVGYLDERLLFDAIDRSLA
ncbi:chemotaxis-related protein WspD [Sphingomonas sp. YR710]|uniref:chemotaxis protein CheW n=1 Tax=Sphingomonas sp. YR710 TaxID=1882773 RepID=UPI000887CDBF|nr:chemotaxis protein CheW [Sphingomonas sp. YR710]SDD05528.1 chemotaxis-related protein WspD [Sphingomonas sp. YR710]